jgi:hypothetical protein
VLLMCLIMARCPSKQWSRLMAKAENMHETRPGLPQSSQV